MVDENSVKFSLILVIVLFIIPLYLLLRDRYFRDKERKDKIWIQVSWNLHSRWGDKFHRRNRIINRRAD